MTRSVSALRRAAGESIVEGPCAKLNALVAFLCDRVEDEEDEECARPLDACAASLCGGGDDEE
jgi:hypothetical protein